MSTLADSISITGTMEATDRRRRIIAIIGASSGNLVEWYDFYRLRLHLDLFPSAQFTMNVWCTPEVICTAHRADEIAQLG
jgi:hypothetical protein